MTDTLQTQTAQAGTSPITPTEAELLAKAKLDIEHGEQAQSPHLHDAAEALATTYELYKTPQRKMAEAIGKSQSWVSQLLTWRREDYKAASPFGPTSKAGRHQHANQKKTTKADATGSGTTTQPAKGSPDWLISELKVHIEHHFPKMDLATLARAKALVAAWGHLELKVAA